jgi:hypothetical protein
MASDLAEKRRNLDWWPVFVREMFAAIGVALDGKPLDPTLDYDIKGPWPDHRIEIAYVSREDFAAERMEEPEGKYFIHVVGKRFGGARWEFRQVELDSLVAEALRNRPPPSS